MTANAKNFDDLMNRLQSKHLNDDELEKISGGDMSNGTDPGQYPKGVFIDIDPAKCPLRLSQFIVNHDGSPSNKGCTFCRYIDADRQYSICRNHTPDCTSGWVW